MLCKSQHPAFIYFLYSFYVIVFFKPHFIVLLLSEQDLSWMPNVPAAVFFSDHKELVVEEALSTFTAPNGEDVKVAAVAVKINAAVVYLGGRGFNYSAAHVITVF